MNPYLSIKSSLSTLLKGLYPAFDIFFEEISKTEEDDFQNEMEDYFFVDIIPVSNVTLGKSFTEMNLVIDIAGHTKAEKNEEYLIMADTIDAAIRPVFHFEDRAITVAETSSKVVDKVLHYTFPLVFVVAKEETYTDPMMGELDVKI